MFARRALVLLSSTLVVAACSGSSAMTSARLPGAPIVGSGSPELRTLDNTGYVYPGGQTTQVSQGVAPGIVGRGAYLTRPPSKEVSLALAPASARGAKSTVPGADPYETVSRIARALCDHETSCARIGPTAAFESADACSTEQRARLVGRVADQACRGALPGDLVAACLRAIRAASCGVIADPAAMPPACDEALSSCS